MRRLKAISCALALILAASSAQAAQLFVDNGATYTVSSNISFNQEFIGLHGTGVINQSSFTNNVTQTFGELSLGYYAGSNGTYNLSGGTLIARNEEIGRQGVGTFNQSGGTNIATFLILGEKVGSSGTYNLSGGSITGDSGGASISIGDQGVGIFNQTGGTNNAHDLSLGTWIGSGTYNLSGGSITGAFFESVGETGTGIFNQSGGTNQTMHLVVGNTATYGGNGTYNLSGGSLTASNFESIGYGALGVGSFNQTGGTNLVAYLLVGDSGGSGTYNLSGGSLSSTGQGIGYGGIGTFNQTGGSNQTELLYVVGAGPGTSGTYNLSGGSLTTTNYESIGYRALGVSTFNQSGGTNQTDYIFVGDGGTGTYNLSGGSLSAPNQRIGFLGGIGIFNQCGGSNLSNYIYVGDGSTGTYNLSGGSLSSLGQAIGYDTGSIGTFNQSGGSNNVNLLILGRYGGSGTYNLSGGELSSDSQYIGGWGIGTFNQSSGSNQTNYLYLGMSGSSGGHWFQGVGTYNLSGGTLSVGDEVIGHRGNGSFLQTGGVHSIAGNLTLAADPGSSGSLAFLGGALTVGGNYIQNAGGSLALGIASASNYQKIAIGGTASLNGTLTPVRLGNGPLGGRVFSGVLTAARGLNGTLTLVDPWISPTLCWRQRYSNTSLDLLVARDYTNPGLGLSANQAAVGAGLNGLAGITSGDLGGVLNTIDNLSNGSEVASAFQQISPDKAASLAT
ncbi:MAG: beta strand repeat-containing protein, partial [Thermodesulfobacteriota bacterium]